MDNQEVRLVKLNWDEEYEKDMLRGKGFELNEVEQTTKGKDGKKRFGIRSPKFGTDWDDDEAFIDRYSCRCKDTVGRVFVGEICRVCNTEVKFVDVDMDVFGWIRLPDHKIINPFYYRKLKSIVGRNFDEVIEIDKIITIDGHMESKTTKVNPFKGIGITEFYARFDEILDYYARKKKNKRELIDEVRADRDKVFTSSIPVFTTIIRPIYLKNEQFGFNKIDKKLNIIIAERNLLYRNSNFGNVNKGKKHERMDEPAILNAIQRNVNQLWESIFTLIDKKGGHIRGQILGGRINFSSRNVIIPDPNLRADEIRIGYMAFIELYKFEIIAHLAKMNDYSHNQAYEDWYKATITFNAKIYEIMLYLVKKRKLTVLINRNPTINYGSILCMHIIEVTPNMDENFTMSIPIQVLAVLNADFDGDILNIISLKTKELAREYDKTFNPRKSMYLSRNDGLFNNDFNLLKDQMIGLYQFNNI